MRHLVVCLLLSASLVAQDAFPRESLTGQGLRVWDFGGESNDEFYFAVLVEVGSRLESDRVLGISHLLEHCLFRGTRHRGWADVSDTLKLATDYNGLTHHDYTSYLFHCSPSDATALIQLFGEMIAEPGFRGSDVEKERQIVYEELMKGVPHRGARTYTQETVLYPGDRLGRGIGGDPERVKLYTSADVKAHYDEHYHVGNVVVAWSGPGDRQAIRGVIERAFAPLRAGREGRPAVSTPRGATGEILFGTPGGKARLVTGFHVDKRSAGSLAALWVLKELVHEQLFRIAREEEALVYSVDVDSVTYLDAWRLQISAEASEGKNIKRVDEILTGIIEDVPKLSMSAIERSRAIALGRMTQLKGLRQWESVVERTWLMRHLGVASPDPNRELHALKREDIERVARGFTEDTRYRITDQPGLGPGPAAPFLAIFGVILGGLFIVDAFYGFRYSRTIVGGPTRIYRRASRRVKHRLDVVRRTRQRRIDVDRLEDEIQDWFEREETEGKRPSGE